MAGIQSVISAKKTYKADDGANGDEHGGLFR